MSAVCRSCRAPIRWERTVNDKPIPLDLDPVVDGNLALTPDGKVYVIPKGDGVLDLPITRYVSHFATCPDHQEWRKP